MTILRDLLFYAMFVLPVLAVIVFFIVSLVLFLKAPKNSPKRKTCKVLLIISSVLLGIFVASVVGIAVMFSMAITYM